MIDENHSSLRTSVSDPYWEALGMRSMIYRPALATGVFALLVFASTASAMTLELGLAIDGSNSISDSSTSIDEFDRQIQGYVKAFSNTDFFSSTVDPSPFDTVAVGVYQFSNGVTEEIAFTPINDQTDANKLANQIDNITQVGGGTQYDDTVNTISEDIFDNNIDSDRQVIDFSTDGQPSGKKEGVNIQAADAARADGIDAINVLAVGATDIPFLEEFADAGNTGFVQTIDNFNAFGSAIEAKLEREIQAIPEPEVGLVAALVLVGFVVYRRRQHKGSLAGA